MTRHQGVATAAWLAMVVGLTGCGLSETEREGDVTLLTHRIRHIGMADIGLDLTVQGVNQQGCVTAELSGSGHQAGEGVLVAPKGTRLHVDNGEPIVEPPANEYVPEGTRLRVGEVSLAGGFGVDSPVDAVDESDHMKELRELAEYVNTKCGASDFVLVWSMSAPTPE